jgi:hypothetical protein
MSTREFALQWIRRHIKTGYQLSSLLDYHGGGGSPHSLNPSFSYALNGCPLFFNDDAAPKTVKYGCIGVALFFADGRKEVAEFSIRELWNEIANFQPKQLSLFDMEVSQCPSKKFSNG